MTDTCTAPRVPCQPRPGWRHTTLLEHVHSWMKQVILDLDVTFCQGGYICDAWLQQAAIASDSASAVCSVSERWETKEIAATLSALTRKTSEIGDRSHALQARLRSFWPEWHRPCSCCRTTGYHSPSLRGDKEISGRVAMINGGERR
jgi:hypothetical protein